MILFHIPRVDSGDLRLWRRALLPAYALRRAGVPTRIVAGDLDRADFTGAEAIIFAGAIGQDTGRLCRLARDAGLRVVLDIADTRSLGGDARGFRFRCRYRASRIRRRCGAGSRSRRQRPGALGAVRGRHIAGPGGRAGRVRWPCWRRFR